MISRLFRFGLSGVLTTGVAYVAFIGLIEGLHWHYALATIGAWIASVGVGFTLNRRFTFGIRGGAQGRQFALFVVGSLLQLALSIGCNAVLIGQWRLNSSLAFLLNLMVTTSFSFAYLNLVAFRATRRAADGDEA